jgi:hypothetical protein
VRHERSSDVDASRRLSGRRLTAWTARTRRGGSPGSSSATTRPKSTTSHRKFFNVLVNLWPGAASPNRALGSRRDPPGAGEPYVAPMPPADLQAHEQAIYSQYGLD